MCTLYERIAELCRSRGVSPSRMCLEVGISKSTMSDMKAGRTKGITTDTAQKIAEYLGVTVGYLLGKEENKKAPTVSGERPVSDDDIKFALFGGSGEITDAMYQEVKEFAALVKLREDMKKKE